MNNQNTEIWTIISSISTLVAAIATSIYTGLTFKLLNKTDKTFKISNKIAEFQIYSEISNLLNNSESNNLFKIISSNWFEIDIMINSNSTTISNPPKIIINSSDLNRVILGPLEDLAKFHHDNLISIESINTGFGNTIIKIWSNEKINKYITKLRNEIYQDNELYSGIETLYKKIQNNLKSK